MEHSLYLNLWASLSLHSISRFLSTALYIRQSVDLFQDLTESGAAGEIFVYMFELGFKLGLKLGLELDLELELEEEAGR